MPKSTTPAGWKAAGSGPKRQQSHGSDVVGASARLLNSKNADGSFKSKVKADSAAKPARKPAATKLRAVYLRPAKGADSEAKLFLVDKKNRPMIVQG